MEGALSGLGEVAVTGLLSEKKESVRVALGEQL